MALEDERDLFRRSVGDVTPMEHDRVLPQRPRPPAVPVQTRREQRRVLHDMLFGSFDDVDLETGEELFHVQPGVPLGVLHKLRRGRLAIEAELDLHGMTVPVARMALGEFLHHSRARGRRCVRVVHGKGRGSHQKQPVLKAKVNHWLRQRAEVLAFCSARPVHGGTGAVYVLLKRGG